MNDRTSMLRTQWLDRWAMYTPSKTAIKDDATGEVFTYASASETANRLARHLQSEHGIRSGDRIAVLSQNCIEYLFLYLAAQQIGAILVPVNYRLAAPEIAFILSDSGAVLLVVQDVYVSLVSGMERSSLPGRTISLAQVRSVMNDRSLDPRLLPFTPGFDDPCMILYTSGTTGRPKGALITNSMVFWNSINTEMRLNITSADVALSFAPFFHTGGWHVLTTPFLHHGATIVLLTGFQAERIVELCDSEGVTILFGVPTMMKMMSETAAFAKTTFQSVRFAIVGGEPMPIPQIELWQAKGVPVRQGFGLTEVGPNCFSLPEEDAIRKKGSIGFPNFYIDTRIVTDNGGDADVNEPGELWMRGPVVTPGYWNNPVATREAISDGWFKTGDIVRCDPEGYFYVVDRKKDMFISGAENVYPAEIERLLYTHPSVAEAAVVGVFDEKWGEAGKAFIVLKHGAAADAETFRTLCRENLAKYKVPKYFAFLSELPKGHSGKVLKRALKELHQATP